MATSDSPTRNTIRQLDTGHGENKKNAMKSQAKDFNIKFEMRPILNTSSSLCVCVVSDSLIAMTCYGALCTIYIF